MVEGQTNATQQATIEQQAAQLAGQRVEMEQQRRTISELTTPVIQVWEGVLALPIVGGVDTVRAQEMTERMLEKVVETGSEIVLLDITGVPVVDTAVARHLLETVAAARLLGAEVLIVGLTTRTAMTLVHLGVDLAGVTTRTTMAKGLELAFARLGLRVIHDGEHALASGSDAHEQ
jgi:rsbT co-antagonist protein RsbR